MSAKTKIQWTVGNDGTPGTTWNPVSGCTKVSEGCDRCYIEGTPPFRMAHRRFDRPGVGGTTGVLLHPDRLGQPLKWRVPRRVFVNSLSDLFHADVPDEYIAKVFATMAQAPRHTFQILTKRPARMRTLLSRPSFRDDLAQYGQPWPLPNAHIGVSCENQKWADLRIPLLMQTPAAVRFLSCEPLLGPIDLRQAMVPLGDPRGHGLTMSFVHWGCCETLHGLDWCIVGGESTRRLSDARPMELAWARSLVSQCRDAGVAPFVKQLGSAWALTTGAGDRKGGDIDEWPSDLRVREFPAPTEDECGRLFTELTEPVPAHVTAANMAVYRTRESTP